MFKAQAVAVQPVVEMKAAQPVAVLKAARSAAARSAVASVELAVMELAVMELAVVQTLAAIQAGMSLNRTVITWKRSTTPRPCQIWPLTLRSISASHMICWQTTGFRRIR